jgi:hypothetical protein
MLFHSLKTKELLKSNISLNVFRFFAGSSADNFEPWQHKILNDTQLVGDIVNNSQIESVWDLLFWISFHPGKLFFFLGFFYYLVNSILDAKTLLPTQVILRLASKSTNLRAIGVFTLLCTDTDLETVELVCKRGEVK